MSRDTLLDEIGLAPAYREWVALRAARDEAQRALDEFERENGGVEALRHDFGVEMLAWLECKNRGGNDAQ